MSVVNGVKLDAYYNLDFLQFLCDTLLANLCLMRNIVCSHNKLHT